MVALLRLFRFLHESRGILTISLIFLLSSTGLMLLQPLMIEFAIDKGIEAGSTSVILLGATGIFVAAILGVSLQLASGYMLIKSSQLMGYAMRNMFVRMGLFIIIQSIILITGTIIFMYMRDPGLAATMAVFMPLTLVLFFIVASFIRPLFMKARTALDELNNTLQENLAGAKVVRAFARQAQELVKFGFRNKNLYKVSLNVGYKLSLFFPLFFLFAQLATLVVVWVGGTTIISNFTSGAEGSLTLGKLVAFNSFASMAMFPLQMLGMVLNFISMAMASATRLDALFREKPGIEENVDAIVLPKLEGAIEFRNVSFRYGQGERALSNIDLEIIPGEKFGIIGATGSGKSTLVNLICRLYDPEEGTVTVDGIDVRDMAFDTLRTRVAIVLQETVLFSGTVRDNIAYSASITDKAQLEKAAEIACASEFINTSTEGWDTPVGERGSGLSGGQRQRVAIARAVASDPDVIVLDDVTSSLDLATEKSIIEALYREFKNRTAIIISQKVQTIREADRIAVMENGRIAAIGKHEDLLQSNKTYRTIYHSRHRGPAAMFATPIEAPKDFRKAFRRFIHYFGSFRILIITATLFIALGTILRTLGPALIGEAIEKDLELAKNLADFIYRMKIVLATIAGSWIADAASGVLLTLLSNRIVYRLRADSFAHVQTLSMRSFDKRGIGDFISRITNDIEMIFNALNNSFSSLIGGLLSMVTILVAMLILSVPLSLVVLAVVPVLAVLTGFIGKKIRKAFRVNQEWVGRLTSNIEESVSGIRVIKTFRKEEAEFLKFDAINDKNRSVGAKAELIAYAMMPLMNFVTSLTLCLVVGAGGYLALRSATGDADAAAGGISIGLLMAFILYSQRFFEPMRQITQVYSMLQSAMAGVERLFEMMDMESEVTEKHDATPLPVVQGAVEFNHVGFSYQAGKPVLEDIHFETRAGQVIAIVGPTGAGKTTLINLLSRFYDVDEGFIGIDGHDIRSVRIDDLRTSMGVVLQEPFFFATSIRENLLYARPDAGESEIIEAARTANAHYFISRLPDGYDTALSERGSNLSQGQRQLLGIARAILSDPRILILDEATSSVDSMTEAHIQEGMIRLMKGRTSFIIAHRLSTMAAGAADGNSGVGFQRRIHSYRHSVTGLEFSTLFLFRT
ncbi:MAG: ABC transporter ATP-binding protein [Acidobacteriota bacterium]